MDSLAQELASDELVLCASEATQAALTTYFPFSRGQDADHAPIRGLAGELRAHGPQPAAPGAGALRGGGGDHRAAQESRPSCCTPWRCRSCGSSDLKFVIIGKVGWLVEGFLEALTPAQRERLIFTGFVSEFVKYRLIAHAEFMVFPSLYEGFGIPALEALSLGKPVLAARTSSFPEVIGAAGVYFDPLSVAEFAAALAEIEAPARLAELKAHTHAQAALFTPERMAAPVLEWVGAA